MAKKKTAKKSVKKSTKKSSSPRTKKSSKRVVKKTAKKTAKKSVKKASKRPVSRPKKKVAKKSSKRVVKKTVKKQVKKTPKRAKKKSTRKSATRSKKVSSSRRKVEVCAACGSPNIFSYEAGKSKVFVCDRCGYKSTTVLKVSPRDVEKTLMLRRAELKKHHLVRTKKRVVLVNHFYTHYELRMWIALIGFMMVVAAVLLAFSSEKLLSLLFGVVGLVLSVASYKL